MPNLNLFTKLKKSFKGAKTVPLALGLYCLIIGLNTSATQAEDNATARFQPGKWPDAYQRLRDSTKEESLKEDEFKRRAREEEEKKEEATLDAAKRKKPTLDNSQTLPSPFQDTDIELNLTRKIDLLLRNSPKSQTTQEQDSAISDHKSSKDHAYAPDREEEDKLDGRDDRAEKEKRREEKRLQKPVAVSPNDWVPDKFDPLNNGGFTTAPDNGSPVPYRLNGHLDLERGRPWLHN